MPALSRSAVRSVCSPNSSPGIAASCWPSMSASRPWPARGGAAPVWRRCVSRRCAFPNSLPDGSFDLIVASEVGYYWSLADLHRATDWMLAAARPEATLLLVHWTAPVHDYPLTGDTVHEQIGRHAQTAGFVNTRSEREPEYRPRCVAAKAGRTSGNRALEPPNCLTFWPSGPGSRERNRSERPEVATRSAAVRTVRRASQSQDRAAQ